MVSIIKKLLSLNKSTRKISVTQYVHANDICIDCGANVGNVTQQMIESGASLVFSFEPNPFAYRELQNRFSYNEKVVLYDKGVWDKASKMKLYFHEWSDQDEVKWSTGSSILSFKKNVRTDKTTEIEIIDLVEFIRGLGKPIGVLKIDIEGAEVELLERILIDRTYEIIRWIFVETHDHKVPELKRRMDIIRKEIKSRKINNICLDWI